MTGPRASQLRRIVLLLALMMGLGVLLAAPTPAGSQAADSALPTATQPSPPATQPDQAAGPGILPSGANVAVIRVEGLIYDFVLESLRRRVDRALQAGASVIVIELDTPGGTVDSALKISKYLKTLPVPTVAWVRHEAYSAGIMIAAACDQIIMAPASATGDCAPIVPGQDLSPTERAKALSPILEEFRDSATANGYDYALFQAMCVLGVEVYLVENVHTGQQRLVNQADYAVMVRGKEIADVIGSVGSTPADQVGGAGLTIATEADRGRWRLVRQIHDGRTLLTLNQDRALEAGLSQATVANEAELQQFLNANGVARVDQSWSEDLAGFLTSPIVKGILIVALLLGAYIEFQTPGIGVAGLIALLALVTLLGAPFLVGLAEVWHLIVFLIGLALLLIELVFIPGFGLLGIGGVVLMFIGLVFIGVPTSGGSSFGPFRLPPPPMWNRLIQSIIYLMAGGLVSFIGFYFITRYFGRVPLLNRLILQDEQPPAMALPSGATASESPPAMHVSGDEVLGQGRLRVGDVGRVTTGLRPAGRAEFDGQIVDVVSLGQWIEPDQPVRIVEIHGNRIVVDTINPAG